VNQIRSERGIITDWLVKLAIGLAVVGVIGYDAGSILVNSFTLDTGATDLAVAVSTEITQGARRNYRPEEIYALATEVLESGDTGVEGAKIVKDGTTMEADGTVVITLRRTADTLIVKRIGAIKDWARATASGQSGTT
jgi:hypothetical protein